MEVDEVIASGELASSDESFTIPYGYFCVSDYF